MATRLNPKAPLKPPQNHLIAALPRADRARLLAACEEVPLVLAEVLCQAAEPAQHAWFPTAGFISLINQTAGHAGLEVGMVGREGMLGVHLVLGVSVSPLQAVVQGSGSAWRLGTAALAAEMAASPALRSLLLRYVHVRMVQLAVAAGCLRFHLIVPRLARWLLMSQDRARSDRFPVTQVFLGYMLGVRRVGITQAAGALQRAGLIHYHRGDLQVLDRAGLEAAACDCFQADRSAYRVLFPAGLGASGTP